MPIIVTPGYSDQSVVKRLFAWAIICKILQTVLWNYLHSFNVLSMRDGKLGKQPGLSAAEPQLSAAGSTGRPLMKTAPEGAAFSDHDKVRL